jgi:hypothetical protein
VSELLGSLKIYEFRKGADWLDQRCGPASPFNLVQCPLGGFGGKVKSWRAKPAPSGTPGVNRDTQANCPMIAMNVGEFGRANQWTTMSSSSNASIAKKARTKAEADFATWLMMAKLGGFDDLPSNAQTFLTNYRARLETMSEAESTALAVREVYSTYYSEMGGGARRRNQRLAHQRQRAKSDGSRVGLNLSPVYRLRAIRRCQ